MLNFWSKRYLYKKVCQVLDMFTVLIHSCCPSFWFQLSLPLVFHPSSRFLTVLPTILLYILSYFKKYSSLSNKHIFLNVSSSKLSVQVPIFCKIQFSSICLILGIYPNTHLLYLGLCFIALKKDSYHTVV